ncbi:MAG: YaiO family outer membrane beta-barrel protein [Candidatus Omnitrophica bacterium]|nr:YaiO family outer membrane beta-barrel protein [Candidatus Omnitrophota bacterium]
MTGRINLAFRIALSISVVLITANARAVDQADTESLLRRITPPVAVMEEAAGKKEEPRDQFYADCFYEPSNIMQGNRTGHWNEVDTTLAYIHRNIRGYMMVNQYERFDNKDYTANIGSYINMKHSYVHLEGGFGWDIDYMYKFQSIVEYGHKLYKTLFWQVGYTYRGYGTDDTHRVYPSLIYYFGDSYMSASYGAGFMEGHDTANFGIVNGDFTVTDFLRWNGGVAFGQRLYDIYAFDASAEMGFILFAGISWKLYKEIYLKAGYSYGEEAPKFMKRSLYFAVSVKY